MSKVARCQRWDSSGPDHRRSLTPLSLPSRSFQKQQRKDYLKKITVILLQEKHTHTHTQRNYLNHHLSIEFRLRNYSVPITNRKSNGLLDIQSFSMNNNQSGKDTKQKHLGYDCYDLQNKYKQQSPWFCCWWLLDAQHEKIGPCEKRTYQEYNEFTDYPTKLLYPDIVQEKGCSLLHMFDSTSKQNTV